ncbi:type IV pilus modification protein PilV [Pseudomonas sp. QE6]|uniref:type IV pilus modification protein PilV n=1 Tax=Pseudomonas sp. QE6 TaxID=3242491 RepID=UPI003528D136
MTLIELMVSIVILSIGLLGLAGLQSTGLASNYSAYYRTQASWLAYEMADLMRANLKAARGSAYNVAFSDVAKGCPKVVDGSRAQSDVSQWLNNICTTLGGTGTGSIQVTQDDNLFSATISVRWNDGRGRIRKADEADSAGDQQTFTYHTSL